MDTTPRINDTDNTLLKKICLLLDGAIPSGVISFNARTGAITLLSADVTGALGYTPVNKAGDTMTGTLVLPTGIRLKLGGTTASFPALKDASGVLQVRKADDSSWASLSAGLVTASTGGLTVVTDDSASVFAYPVLYKKRGTTGDAAAAVTTGSELGHISWQAWNGTAYVTGAQIVAKTTQNQSVGNAGSQLDFRTCGVGAAAAGIAAFITSAKNFVLSNVTTTEPASLVGGVVFKDGTAASADPTTGSAIWSVAGALQYRTSGASDGSGVTNHLHNRSAQQAGVGTDYTLTNTLAQVAFGTTNAAVTLPTAGTYLILANVSVIDGANSGDVYSAKLRNTTDSTDVGVAKKNSGSLAAGRLLLFLAELVTTTAANKVVSIFAANETAARGSVESTSTDIRYVRLA